MRKTTLFFFSTIFQKAICQNIKSRVCSVAVAWVRSFSLRLSRLVCKRRFCLKPSMGDANMPASHLSLEIELVIHLPIHHPSSSHLYIFPRVSQISSLRQNYNPSLVSRLSVWDVYPGWTQSCFKLMYYLYFCLYTRCLWKLHIVLPRAVAGKSVPNGILTIKSMSSRNNIKAELNGGGFRGLFQQEWCRLNIRVTDALTTLFWPTLSSTIWAENERSQCTLRLLHFMLCKPSVRTFYIWSSSAASSSFSEVLHLTVDYFLLLIPTLWSCTISQTRNGEKKITSQRLMLRICINY